MWDKWGRHFFGVAQEFYLNQPSFSTVEWNFCKWAKYNGLFIEEPEGTFHLQKNVAIVVQGDGDFFFLHKSLLGSKSKNRYQISDYGVKFL
mgnify:CR=1 FL=1